MAGRRNTILTALLAGAAPLAQHPLAAQNTIPLAGEAEISVIPDRVIPFLGVETRHQSLDAARAANDRGVRPVVEAMRRGGSEGWGGHVDLVLELWFALLVWRGLVGVQGRADGPERRPAAGRGRGAGGDHRVGAHLGHFTGHDELPAGMDRHGCALRASRVQQMHTGEMLIF